jgi:hypothetical protein
MKKKLTVLLIWLFAISGVSNILADGIFGELIPFALIQLRPHPGDDNANNGGSPRPRGPITSPVVEQNANTLYIISGCEDTDLVLLDEAEEEVYTQHITVDTDEINLPNTLQGIYQLQIRIDEYAFVADIEL